MTHDVSARPALVKVPRVTAYFWIIERSVHAGPRFEAALGEEASG